MVTIERLRQLLRYNKRTGVFTWRVRKSQKLAGQVAGSISKISGYVEIRIDGKLYCGHRLAWFYVKGEWPPFEIDHRHEPRSNNAWRNLRDATHAQNGHNRGPRKNNKSGLKGAHVTRSGKWASSIRANGEKYRLGTFDSPQAAHDAYMAKAAELHQEFARAA